MLTHTMLESVLFFSSIIFLVFEVYSETTPNESSFKQRKQRSISFENGDISRRSYDPVHATEFQPCDDSSFCTPVRQCSTLRHLWHRRNVGILCGPYRRVCCPREEVPSARVLPPAPAIENIEAISDDSQEPTKFRTCDASSYCIPIRRCSSLREGWNRRGVGITCGLGEGPYRMVCCPRGYGQEVRDRQEIEQTRLPRTTTPLPPPGEGNSEECGLSQEIDWYREHAENETDALDATWPWMVAIVYRRPSGSTDTWCSGSLISKTHVLTAAHCLSGVRDLGSVSARIGSDDQDLAEEYPIREVKQPEDYKRKVFYHDIAILTLAREVNTPDVVPICLPDERIADLDLTGWGATILGWGTETSDGPSSKTLKQLDNVPILSNSECSQIYGNGSAFPDGITEDMLCSGLTEGARETCYGDSGAPAMILYKKRWYVVGITLFGNRLCGVPGYPTGFTRISSYVNWIRQNTENGSSANHSNDSTLLSL